MPHDLAQWVERFEAPERTLWQKPAEVIGALGVARGTRVVDIGAGTGYFSVPLARATGARGVVYAAEIEPALVDHVAARALREHAPAVRPWRCSSDALNLPERVDLALLCNTYHHLEDRPAYIERLKKDLNPGARVAIVDWHKRSLKIGPPREMKIGAGDVLDELEAAGFVFVERFTFLPYQYFLVFRT